jgi:hypothetical protein
VKCQTIYQDQDDPPDSVSQRFGYLLHQRVGIKSWFAHPTADGGRDIQDGLVFIFWVDESTYTAQSRKSMSLERGE